MVRRAAGLVVRNEEDGAVVFGRVLNGVYDLLGELFSRSVSFIRQDKGALHLPRHRLGGGKEGAR